MTPLVLVHGFMGGSDQWEGQMPLGAERQLVCVDLPGFGRHAHLPPIHSITGFAEWVLHEVKANRFDLLGHSMGGMIVQEMVRLAPARIDRLILYGTGAIGELPGRFEPIETSMQRAQADGAQATARRISATWFKKRDAAEAYPACAKIAQASRLPAILAGLEAMRGWSGEDHLPLIQCPTLVLWGDKDRTYAWPQIERLWQSIPHCNLAVVPDAAHAVHLERPKLFNQLIDDFLTHA
ncbi:alpha/beta fold hydrolase [Roseovarius phycicola]|uniref:Alpha/beta hydrolase n=1 Tax=Roseovarius phycicola TaxID=3080976 RepID=A0ABZ2HLI8_9RHOB